MSSFKQEFTIHPIGQGLFYSGVFTLRSPYSYAEKTFRMAIDCGSTNRSSCKREAGRFRDQFLVAAPLDLLVISHFDSDHVSHIGELLQHRVQVRKLVMPLVTFPERLFLVLRLVAENGYDPEDDYPIRLAIDPLGTLRDNLDGNTEIFLIDPGPTTPTEAGEPEYDKPLSDDPICFDFARKAEETLSTADLESLVMEKGSFHMSKVKDNHPGRVYETATKFQLVEYLFYHRQLGKKHRLFFETVKKLFFEIYDISEKLRGQMLLDAVIDKVRNITNGKRIREIFKEAAKDLELETDGNAIYNLNTTALCLVHKNLPDILASVNRDRSTIPDFYPRVSVINAFDSQSPQPIFNDWPLLNRSLSGHLSRGTSFIYPNVLLTSDAFIKKETEVSRFYQKFKSYLQDVWLFQVPHHGSVHSSDLRLYSCFHQWHYHFINFGTRNKHGHPYKEVMDDLLISGHMPRYFPIHEYSGLHFEFSL